jgi:hypothetical protein
LGSVEPPAIPGVSALVRIDSEGFCAVYRGRQVDTGRGVAVKILPAPFDRAGRVLFERERSRLGRLRHVPAILPVDTVGMLPDGRPYLMSELCAESCAEVVQRHGPLHESEVCALGRDLADALARAHELDLVHGAVTPHNVLFRRSGQVALCDFGLALRQAYVGDPTYGGEFAAPETLRDGTLTARTDLYGLGGTLYFALVGEPPFPTRVGEHPSERILRVIGETAPTVEGTSPGLRAMLAELLATEPEERPGDAAGVAARFAAMATAMPPPAVEVRTQGSEAAQRQAAPELLTEQAVLTRWEAPAGPVAARQAPTDSVVEREAPAEPVAARQAPVDSVVEWQAPAEPVAARQAPRDSGTEREAPAERAEERQVTAEPAAEREVRAEPSADRPEPVEPADEGPAPAEPVAQRPAPAAARGGPSVESQIASTPVGASLAAPAISGEQPALPGKRVETSTNWSGLLDEVLCEVEPVDQSVPAAFVAPRAPVTPPAAAPAAPRERKGISLVAAVMVGLLLLAVVAVVSHQLSSRHPSASSPTTAPPSPSSALAVRLVGVKDAGQSVSLTWTGAPSLEYAVVVAQAGQPAQVKLVRHAHSARVPVVPGYPYCFVVQATNGKQVIETDPKSIRGAVCHT